MTDATKIRQSALRMLARREHSCFELKQKLLQRNYEEELIEQELKKLIIQDILSEQRFLENFVRSRITKGHGPARIKIELQEKGIIKETIMDYLVENKINWLEKIEQVRHKKFKNNWPQDAKENAKQIRYLQYKGFSLDQIQQAKIKVSKEIINHEYYE